MKIVEKTLARDTVVQVLDVEDVGRSKWEQIESLESERKGETTKGRQVIRVVAQAEGGEPGARLLHRRWELRQQQQFRELGRRVDRSSYCCRISRA